MAEGAKVSAVITAYQPDGPALARLISVMLPQVSSVFVVDDGSGPAWDVAFEMLGPQAVVTRQAANTGIAHATNSGITQALESAAEFVVLFDQDSMPEPDLVRKLTDEYDATSRAGFDVGAVVPGRHNGLALRDLVSVGPHTTVLEAIQSGMLVPRATFEAVGLLREEFFIDLVDIDFTLRMADAERPVVVAEAAAMEHPIGRRVQVRMPAFAERLRGRAFSFSYHTPFRRYFIVRNRTVLLLENWRQRPSWALRHLLREVRVAALGFLFVTPRLPQLRAIVLGLGDGLLRRGGPPRHHLKKD